MSTEHTARTSTRVPSAIPLPSQASTKASFSPLPRGHRYALLLRPRGGGLREGEEAEFVYKVISGAVRTHKVLSDGPPQITGFHLPGDLFGFEQGACNRHTAEALTNNQGADFQAAAGRACRDWKCRGRLPALGYGH